MAAVSQPPPIHSPSSTEDSDDFQKTYTFKLIDKTVSKWSFSLKNVYDLPLSYSISMIKVESACLQVICDLNGPSGILVTNNSQQPITITTYSKLQTPIPSGRYKRIEGIESVEGVFDALPNLPDSQESARDGGSVSLDRESCEGTGKFLLHPLHQEHAKWVKVAAVAALVFLTLITAGLYLIGWSVVRLVEVGNSGASQRPPVPNVGI